MWALLLRRFRTWLILAIGLPLIDWLLGKISARIEAKQGQTKATAAINRARGAVRSVRPKRRG